MPYTPDPMDQQVRYALEDLQYDVVQKGYHFEGSLELNGSDSYNSVIREVRTQAEAEGWVCAYNSTQGPVDACTLRMHKGSAVLKLSVEYDDTMKLEAYIKS